MTTDVTAIENEIQKKGLTAHRITSDHIYAAIDEEVYHPIDDTTVTVCVLKLKNGFTVVGYSACVSEENFDAELGKKIARQKAFDQCWSLFGFHLASVLSGWSMDS